MTPVPSGVRVWLATGVTDMRRGMNTLALQVQESLGRDPHGGDLFIFRGRRGDLVKCLWHDGGDDVMAVFEVRGEHAVVSGEMGAGARHEGGEAGDMQAFEGIRVLDMTHVLAGPFSTNQLAVLGADVIKIEPVGNPDMNRDVGAVDSLNDAGMGTHFQSQGANKRAMSLNLKSGKGREIFKALATDADVIVENFRAGALERLGLGYADLCAVKPDIIYCSITGFGQTGPKRGHGAFDNVIQA